MMESDFVVIFTLLLGVLGAAAWLVRAATRRRRTPDRLPTVTTTEPEPVAPPHAAGPSTDGLPSESVHATDQATGAASATPAEATPPAASRASEVSELRSGLQPVRGGMVARLRDLLFAKPTVDESLLEQMEEVLITSDVGVKTSMELIARLRTRLAQHRSAGHVDPREVWQLLREEILHILLAHHKPPRAWPHKPAVILIVGVNGAGKTTTIGKLALRHKNEGRSVVMAAGDTFRAAATLQLEVWGRRVGCPVVQGSEGADPSAVIFDGIQLAKNSGADLVLADTAGRLHTKANLMQELSKVGRVAEKALDGRKPDEIWLVLDSTAGQNAMMQAKVFLEALPVTGFILTKLDGSAKGGAIIGIVHEYGLPVRYIGIGEKADDLKEFHPEAFVDALLDDAADASQAA
jgi:fused signal recognition particle receptor